MTAHQARQNGFLFGSGAGNGLLLLSSAFTLSRSRFAACCFGPAAAREADRPPGKRRADGRAMQHFVVFTLENINDRHKAPVGKLYLNGKLQGAVEKWNLTFDWDPAKVLLVLGASYVGYMNDLAVFDRALRDVEVDRIYGLKKGIRALYP
jgi:hypothetical protein